MIDGLHTVPDGAIRAADGTLVAYLSQPGVSQQ